MKQKLFTLFLALLASVGLLSASVVIDGIAYNLNETELTAQVSSDDTYSGNIVIPESVTYYAQTYSVISIGGYAFSSTGLTSITIPNSVISIGAFAFAECSSLTSVTIPNSVTSIGTGAFILCWGLTSVTIGNSVTSIGKSAFANCTGLTSVTIPSSVTSIDDYAFAVCSGLTSITIPNSVTSIGNFAFQNCTGLTSVTIGNSVTSIGKSAFANCTGLTNIYATCGDLYRLKQLLDNDSRVKYAPIPYSLVIHAENGMVVTNYDSLTICDEPNVTCTVTPNDGYHFVQWSDGVTTNPRTIFLTQDTVLSAAFAINTYMVRFFGFDNVLLDSQSIEHGATAVAPEAPTVDHFDFVGWDKEFTNITSDLDVYAIYQKNTEDVENVNIDALPYKMMIDNQILILRGEKVYSLQGQEVR